MSNLVIPRREIWTQQPSQLSGIDKGNRFGSLVDSWYLASEFKSKQASIITPNGVATDFSSQYVIGNSPSVAGRPFTLVFVFTMPAANVGPTDSVYVGSGNGFRATPSTSSGGMYWPWTANDVANGNDSPRDASGVFDNRKIVLVSDWTATGQTSWWKRDGMAPVSWSDAFGYIPPTDLSVKIGQSGNGAAKFLAAYVLEGNVGAQGAAEIIKNPWQVFAPRETRLFVPVSGGGSVNANASGALSAVAVTAPSASASGSASANGACAAISISSPTATASAGGSASASGSFASLTLAAPNATATASGVGAGSFAALSITPATATATATTSATASGAFAAISLSAPNATATGTTAGNAIATATPAQITINPATASAIGSAVASGAFAALSITPPTATATSAGDAHAIAAFAALSINPTTGAAYGSAIATGSLPVISLSPATGAASTGTFTGSISDEDITRIVQAVLLQLNNESIAAAVLAAINASPDTLTVPKFIGLS